MVAIQLFETVPDLDTSKGWEATLELEVRKKHNRSVVSRSRQTGPLTVQNPFYPEGDTCHLYLLHPPAGVVGGDRLHLGVTAAENGHVLLTTPGATKFYRTNGKLATQSQYFKIHSGAAVEWLPQETIYFPDAVARLDTIVELEEHGQFLGWDIHCLGLPANKKDFNNGKASISLKVYRNDTPVLLESMNISPEKRQYDAAFLKGRGVFGTMLATGGHQETVEALRDQLPQCTGGLDEEGLWAITAIDDLVVLRYLGASVNQARELFIQAWEVLRPHVMQQKAVVPRIWAT